MRLSPGIAPGDMASRAKLDYLEPGWEEPLEKRRVGASRVTDEVQLNQMGLRDAVHRLDQAGDFDEAQLALIDIADAMRMPVLSWAPDVAWPAFNPLMDAFMRRRGWPPEALELWWDRNAMLKTPVYIRCRTRAMPFVTRIQPERKTLPPELRRTAAIMRVMGVESLITIPVHLPRGQIAMVSMGGSVDAAAARAKVQAARPELVAAGQLFMAAYDRLAGVGSATAEERVKLTPREWECLRLTAQGCREEEVASLVSVAATTVRFHMDNVVRKLGASNRTHAAALAAQLGMLGPIS